jgi:hypothetical protein
LLCQQIFGFFAKRQTKVSQKWFKYEQTMTQGLSIRKSADSCKIARNASFKWPHRFLQMPATCQPGKMNGTVEADDTCFLESLHDNVVCLGLHADVMVKPPRKEHQKNRCLYWWCATIMAKLPTVYCCMAQVLSKSSQRLFLCEKIRM